MIINCSKTIMLSITADGNYNQRVKKNAIAQVSECKSD